MKPRKGCSNCNLSGAAVFLSNRACSPLSSAPSLLYHLLLHLRGAIAATAGRFSVGKVRFALVSPGSFWNCRFLDQIVDVLI